VRSTFNRYSSSLLVRYLTGESTPEEAQEVGRWMAADPSHKRYADELFEIWEGSRRLGPPRPLDAAAAWERFVQSGKIPVTGGGAARIFPWRAVAAAVVLVVAGVCSWWALKEKEGAGLSIKAGSAVRTDTLPDGSRVTLNKFSSLELSGSRGSRVAKLKGEAFFQVAHEPNRPFTVEVGGVVIRDVGTSFDVRSVNGTTEVIVEDGAILVSDSTQAVKAVAGEKVVIGSRHGEISKTTTGDKLYQYYRTKKFVCHNTPLPELLAALNQAYGVKIVLRGNAGRGLLLTTTFDNDNLDSILSVITLTFGLVKEKNGDMIILCDRY